MITNAAASNLDGLTLDNAAGSSSCRVRHHFFFFFFFFVVAVPDGCNETWLALDLTGVVLPFFTLPVWFAQFLSGSHSTICSGAGLQVVPLTLVPIFCFLVTYALGSRRLVMVPDGLVDVYLRSQFSATSQNAVRSWWLIYQYIYLQIALPALNTIIRMLHHFTGPESIYRCI